MSLPLVTRFGANPLLDLEVANKNYVDNAGGFVSRVLKLVDETRTTDTVLSDDNELFFPVEVDSTYRFWLFALMENEALPDMKFIFTLPTNCVGNRMGGPWQAVTYTLENDMLAQRAQAAATGLKFVNIYGLVRNGDTAGNVQYQWAQNGSSPNTITTFAGSSILIWKLNG